MKSTPVLLLLTGESRRIEHETVSPGRCLYYTDPLECWARQESRGLNWLRLAREYNSSFDYDFPDTCRYTSRSFRCTIPLPGHLATILHTLTMYNLRYQIKMADRGPYGLHLDFLMNLELISWTSSAQRVHYSSNSKFGTLKRAYTRHLRWKYMIYRK